MRTPAHERWAFAAQPRGPEHPKTTLGAVLDSSTQHEAPGGEACREGCGEGGGAAHAATQRLHRRGERAPAAVGRAEREVHGKHSTKHAATRRLLERRGAGLAWHEPPSRCCPPRSMEGRGQRPRRHAWHRHGTGLSGPMHSRGRGMGGCRWRRGSGIVVNAGRGGEEGGASVSRARVRRGETRRAARWAGAARAGG
jgi:hypothetical protein